MEYNDLEESVQEKDMCGLDRSGIEQDRLAALLVKGVESRVGWIMTNESPTYS
jgi:hypothetical protein